MEDGTEEGLVSSSWLHHSERQSQDLWCQTRTSTWAKFLGTWAAVTALFLRCLSSVLSPLLPEGCDSASPSKLWSCRPLARFACPALPPSIRTRGPGPGQQPRSPHWLGESAPGLPRTHLSWRWIVTATNFEQYEMPWSAPRLNKANRCLAFEGGEHCELSFVFLLICCSIINPSTLFLLKLPESIILFRHTLSYKPPSLKQELINISGSMTLLLDYKSLFYCWENLVLEKLDGLAEVEQLGSVLFDSIHHPSVHLSIIYWPPATW